MQPFRTFLLTLAAACLAFAADPALLRMVPPDAAFIAGIHADQVKTSRFGQFLLDQLKSEEASMNKFISATGFDPRRDVAELIVASTDVRGKRQGKTLVIARGRFDAARIQSFARLEGSATMTYQGISIWTKGHDEAHSFAILDESTAVAGDTGSLKFAVDHRDGATALDAKLVTKITDLSLRYDAWMVSATLDRLADDIASPQLEGAMQGNLFKAMDSVVGGVRFGANIEVMAEAQMRSEKDASSLVDVVRFLGGMLQMNSGNNDPRSTELMSLIEKMDLKATGNQFRMSLMIPEDMIEKLVKPASKKI
ncbi:MAG TPA: hypothetical protein VM120_09210 [Bryobacteraceae bacterium]|nr:hypothetical protein [Bryobacteraceae bacterium]